MPFFLHWAELFSISITSWRRHAHFGPTREQGQTVPEQPPNVPKAVEDTLSVRNQRLPYCVCVFVRQDTYEADPVKKFNLETIAVIVHCKLPICISDVMEMQIQAVLGGRAKLSEEQLSIVV